MRYRFFVVSMLLALVLGGCKTGTAVTGGATANNSLNAKDIVASHNLASPKFNTLASRLQVAYKDEKKEQSITVSLRMKKDEKIWIKASILGITLAKVLITPESVSYYETISNTYFDGNFELLSDWLGTELDFEKTQAILLGQSIFDLNKNYESSIAQNRYKLEPTKQPQNFIHSLFLNSQHFKVVSGSLSQPEDKRLLSLKYGEYQQIEESFYPTTIHIDATQESDKTNVSLSFPFTIPDGYEEIRLSK